MPKQPVKSVRVQLVAPPDFIKSVDRWRRKQPDIPNRSDAIRQLVGRGLLYSPKTDTTNG